MPPIYIYPPRRTFNRKCAYDIEELWRVDYENSNKISIYIHIPFWEKKCTFCNLYAYEINNDNIVNSYVESLIKQIQSYKDVLFNKQIYTLYMEVAMH